MMQHFVYALTDPVTDIVNYVGMTDDASARYKRHCNPTSDDQSTKANWIRDLRASSLLPGLKILEIVDSEDMARDSERYWIKYYHGQCASLKNVWVPSTSTIVVKPELRTLQLLLRYWRRRRALNIRQLAQLSHVSSATIVKIENDHYVPRPDVTQKLAGALSISVDELLVDDEERPSKPAA